MYLNHIILYECHGSSPEMEIMSREYGKMCPQPSVARPFGCNNIVATWVRGSDVSTVILMLIAYRPKFVRYNTSFTTILFENK